MCFLIILTWLMNTSLTLYLYLFIQACFVCLDLDSTHGCMDGFYQSGLLALVCIGQIMLHQLCVPFVYVSLCNEMYPELCDLLKIDFVYFYIVSIAIYLVGLPPVVSSTIYFIYS